MLNKLKALTLIKALGIEAQPFVFEPTSVDNPHLPTPKSDILACPFPVFTLEYDRTYLTVDYDTGVNISAILCSENEPGDYTFHALIDSPYGEHILTVTKENEAKSAYPNLLALCELLIERMYTHKRGTVSLPGKAKIKGHRAPFKPNACIYIANRPNTTTSEPDSLLNGRKVAWSNSWLVRAHWRRIAGKGLNRFGERVVNGYTWIKEHQKGAGEVKLKVRKLTEAL